MWFAWLRPWVEFDDLKEAYYTGHHDDHHHEDGIAEMAHEPTAVVVTEPIVPAVAEEESIVPAVAEEKPVVVESKKDDLKIIEGIGNKVEQALNTEGITSFAQVAAMTGAELHQIVKGKHGVRIVGSTASWPRQARLADSGDKAALDELKSRIKSGHLYDKLADIEGVGPIIEKMLYDAGIRSFEELAATEVARLRQIVNDPMIDPESWPQQAKYLAAGDLSGLETYQRLLHGGRD
jgi:predicted flap endonuclease-1-like 5' DNA nuclease